MKQCETTNSTSEHQCAQAMRAVDDRMNVKAAAVEACNTSHGQFLSDEFLWT